MEIITNINPNKGGREMNVSALPKNITFAQWHQLSGTEKYFLLKQFPELKEKFFNKVKCDFEPFYYYTEKGGN